nr:hypothetical transcript [Hymenolepis microstoma]
MKLNILVVFCLLAVSLGSPLPTCGCQAYPCNHEHYPYAINGGQTPEENPSSYNARARPNSAFPYDESRYQYPSHMGENSNVNQGTYGGQPNPPSYTSDHSHQNSQQQSSHRSITLTWRLQGDVDHQMGKQRPSASPPHPQSQNQRPWNAEHTSPPGSANQPTWAQRPAVQPTRTQRPSVQVSVYGNDANQLEQQGPSERPTPRPRHQANRNAYGSEDGNPYGGMTGTPYHPLQILPYPLIAH